MLTLSYRKVFQWVAAAFLQIIRRLMLGFTREPDYVVAGEGTDGSNPIKIDRLRYTELREIPLHSVPMRVRHQLNHDNH